MSTTKDKPSRTGSNKRQVDKQVQVDLPISEDSYNVAEGKVLFLSNGRIIILWDTLAHVGLWELRQPTYFSSIRGTHVLPVSEKWQPMVNR